MQQLYDQDLVEEVVFLCARVRRTGIPALQIRRFHAGRERLYSILDAEERDAAFFQLHLEWFREWGLEGLLAGIRRGFPLLDNLLKVLAFRKARTKTEEGAELYINDACDRHGIVALRPERFETDARLTRFLNHELMHLHDMVDPAFGYCRDIAPPGQTLSQQRLIRDRYRILWDVTIDGRLINAHRVTQANMEQRCAEFNRAFGFLPEAKRASTFQQLWNNLSPRQADLVLLASDPREVSAARQQVLGGLCPLCDFPTFQWAKIERLRPDTLAAVQGSFPGWSPGDGACQRCIEIYESALAVQWPSTLSA